MGVFDSKEQLSLVNKWIHECLSTHTHCRLFEEDSLFLPTRLLDVGRPGSLGNMVYLVNSATDYTTGEYVTLSHRWSSKPHVKLIESTHDDFAGGIQLNILQQTFQDAIQVTRRLNVRYLWIDSLCIIQEQQGQADWSHEASLMEKVYLHSYCNISALAAANSSDTMFTFHDQKLFEPPTLTVNQDNTPLSYMIYDRDTWRSEVDNHPLHGRGWIFQERLLSPRVLYFGDDQLFWECQEKQAAEFYPDQIPLIMQRVSANLKATFRNHRARLVKGELDLDKASAYPKLWSDIVVEYAKCELTQPTDRLVALAGVARMMAGLIQDEYVCGLWKQSLGYDLLWCVRGEPWPNSPPEAYCAPSWSWAALYRRISPNIDHRDAPLLIDIEHVEVKYATADIYGQVKGGSLFLRGAVKRIELGKVNRVGRGTVVFVEPNCSSSCLPLVYMDVKDSIPSNLYCLPFAGPTTSSRHCISLLLESVALTQPVWSFRRVGIMHTDDLSFRRAITGLELNEDDLFSSKDLAGRRSISLI